MMENNFQIDSAAVSDRGLSKKRPQNEDSFLELNERGLFAVADGVGGAQAGDVASKIAVEILGEAFINLQKNNDAEETMKIAIERANQAIFQMAHDLPQLSTMATTIVAVHIAGNIATIGHVGDSRLYRLDVQGNLHRETQDHSVVEEEVQAGRMTAQQAANHPNKNIISRALGADNTVEVDMKTIMFEPDTTFLACSDGITRHLDDSEIRDLLLVNESPSSVCQKMKEICYERGAEDNLTAVIAKVTGSVLESLPDSKADSPADFEEATIATARPVETGNSIANKGFEDTEEFTTQNLQMPVSKPVNLSETKIASETLETQKNINRSEEIVFFEEQRIPSEKAIVHPNTSLNADDPGRDTQRSKSSLLGKVLSALLFLVFGAGLGAGAYYLWLQNNKLTEVPEVSQTSQIQTQNIPYAAFEENRRSLDKNPEQYISTAAEKAENAEDYYLLGRAYLLTGKNPQALTAFKEAKNRLAQANEVNSAVLANEIAMSMAILNNSAAQKEFDQNKANANLQTNGNTQNNSNATNTLQMSNQQF